MINDSFVILSEEGLFLGFLVTGYVCHFLSFLPDLKGGCDEDQTTAMREVIIKYPNYQMVNLIEKIKTEVTYEIER